MKIQVGDIAMEVEVDGSDDDTTIFLHHSLATSLRMWDDLAIALCQNDRVVRFDARGHGKSEAPQGPYNFEQLTKDVIGLMDALGIDKAHHVGLSMGGMVCQCLGFMAPERVQSLTLVSTASDLPDEARAAWDKRLAEVLQEGVEPQVAPTLKRWFTRDFRAEGNEVLERIGDLIRNTPVNGYSGWGAAIRNLNLTEQLREIKAPSLVLVGAEDPGTPPAMSEVIRDAIPGAQMKVFPNLSHMLPLEAPDLFLETLIDFIEAVDDDTWGEDSGYLL